jgi:uncharacterized DUF497 family protein
VPKFRYEKIEWDENNVFKNEISHGVKYYEIEEAIENEPKVIIPHKKYNDRLVLLGRSDAGRYLFVVYQAKKGGIIRPIHARDMAKEHKKFYQKHRKYFK